VSERLAICSGGLSPVRGRGAPCNAVPEATTGRRCRQAGTLAPAKQRNDQTASASCTCQAVLARRNRLDCRSCSRPISSITASGTELAIPRGHEPMRPSGPTQWISVSSEK
jgi:hypothetical protein